MAWLGRRYCLICMINICLFLQECGEKNHVDNEEITVLLWSAMMKIEWNKKDDLLAEQTFAHLRKYAPVFTSFATTAQIELLLLQKVGSVV